MSQFEPTSSGPSNGSTPYCHGTPPMAPPATPAMQVHGGWPADMNGHGFPAGFPAGYPVGLSPAGFMAMPAPYPPGFAPCDPMATDPSTVTVAAARPQSMAPTTGGAGNGTNGHANGNGHQAPRLAASRPAAAPMPGTATPTERRLADLVVRAEGSIDELERLARTALDATSASTQAASDLQERLRLGVRMLQAFDVQIQRCEQAGSQAASAVQSQISSHLNGQLGTQVGTQMVAHFTQQFSTQAASVAQQCEQRVRAAVDGLDRRMNEALPFLDERLRQAYEQAGRIVDERLAAAERAIEDRYGPMRDDLRRFADELATSFARRLDAMMDERLNERVATLVESTLQTRLASMPMQAALPVEELQQLAATEDRVRSLLRETEGRIGAIDASLRTADLRLASLIRETTEAADGLLGTLGTASALKDLIGDEARASRRMADEAHATSREHQREIQDLLERCSIARSSLDQQLHLLRETAAEADGRIHAAKDLRGEIEETLRRIGPIEAALRTDSSPMQQVVESISSNVRQALAEDMRSFSQALRGLASRAEHAFAPARFDEFSPMPGTMTMASTSGQASDHHTDRMHDAILDLVVDHSLPTDHETVDADIVLPTITPAVHAGMHADMDPTSLMGALGDPTTDAHAGSMSTLPIDTQRLTAEIMALDATSLLRAPLAARHDAHR